MNTNTKRGFRPLDAQQQALALSAIRLAYRLANRAVRMYGLDREEAEDIAVDRLLSAARYHDPARGFRFTTLAWKSIRRALAWHAHETAKSPRRRTNRIDTARSSEDGALACDPADTRTLSPVQQAEHRDACSRVAASLSPRTWRILWSYFAEGCTLTEIAGILGLSYARVQEIVSVGIARARAALPGMVEGEVVPRRSRVCLSEIAAEVVRLRSAGRTIAEISVRLDCSRAYVFLLLRKGGWRPTKRCLGTPENVTAVMRLREQGLSLRRIASELGCSTTSVVKLIAEGRRTA